MFVTANELSLHLTSHGAGRPILLLHGFTGSGRSWGSFADRLHGRRRLLLDLVGHGGSDAPATLDHYRMPQVVTDLLTVLDLLRLPSIDLLGYSMGGRTALQLAVAAPQRVRRLILIGATAGLAEPAERRARIAADEALASRMERDGLSTFVSDWAAQPIFATQQAALSPDERSSQRLQRLTGSVRGYANALRGLGSGAQSSLWGALAAVSAPTLLLSGALDTKFTRIAQQLAAELPTASRIVVPGCGHAVQLEQPLVTARIVNDFLNDEAADRRH